MADFRKWFLVVAVVLLATASAFAQSQINTIPCTTSAQVPVIRNLGITEYIGEVDLACDSTQVTGIASLTVQFMLSVNSTVTNADETNGTDNLGPLTMAGLAVMTQQQPQTILRTVQGRVGNDSAGNTNNALRFPHVILPIGTTFIVRFFNVRVAATPFSVVTNPFGFTEIFGLVNANTENPTGYTVSFTNQPAEGILVATVAQTLKVAVTDCTGGAVNPINYQQCIDYVLRTRELPGRAAATINGITFTELQQTAFKNIVEEDGATMQGTLSGPLICDTGHEAVGYVAVIGDVPPIPACADEPAWVSNGTRLLAQFAVPDTLVGKIHIWVSDEQTASTTGATAELATDTSDVGWGDDITGQARTHVPCGPEGNNWVELPDGATATATWEITNDNLGDLDDITFAWTITYMESDLPTLPVGNSYAIQLGGGIAPFTTQAVPAPTTITDQPVVRFVKQLTNTPLDITISHCVTNLLYPYVTNIVGFETGIAISNTSLDTAWNLTNPPTEPGDANGVVANWGAEDNPLPYNTTPQAGPCNLYLFGSATAATESTAGTDVLAIASATTPDIPAGQVFADTLTSIFNLNGGDTPITLSGYVIARCEFQFGHGYAFLVNPQGAPQGYLGLVIPDRNILNGDTSTGVFSSTPIRIAQPFSNAIFDEQGEVLAQ